MVMFGWEKGLDTRERPMCTECASAIASGSGNGKRGSWLCTVLVTFHGVATTQCHMID